MVGCPYPRTCPKAELSASRRGVLPDGTSPPASAHLASARRAAAASCRPGCSMVVELAALEVGSSSTQGGRVSRLLGVLRLRELPGAPLKRHTGPNSGTDQARGACEHAGRLPSARPSAEAAMAPAGCASACGGASDAVIT